MTTAAKLRQQFLEFFQNKGHEVVPSASLIPNNDPTLLFVNAGMVQFKDVFLGHDERGYSTAVSSQRCVRAGGKHNDLEQVGYTARHHTFFEMLGNFSFGDYFKREAISYAWELLTEVFKIPTEKLWVTVYEDDDETAKIWLEEMQIDSSRFSRCGAADNFWSMGDTGPCGPCTEIFYDHGESIPGGPPGSPDQDGDRYVEIWNLVFMQFDRLASGELVALPKPSVDTGMGLERLAAVMQGVHDNYDTDLFQHLLTAVAKLSKEKDFTNKSLRVIADHIRACSFLIIDGVTPANEGRGYVLRRIIRRAIRHGHKVGISDVFFHKLVAALVEIMGDAYPELSKAQSHIEHVLKIEEEQFVKTLDQGLKILEQDLKQLEGDVISGKTIFKLYDTYGFPADLTGDIAREKGLSLDLDGFAEEMAKQRKQSQKSGTFAADYHSKVVVEEVTEFSGYEFLEHVAVIEKLFLAGEEVDELKPEQEGLVVLKRTPFYAESGGQVGDQGTFEWENGLFTVTDTQKHGKGVAHYGVVKQGSLRVGTSVNAKVDLHIRQATVLNHSATHLLHAALRQIIGEHVTQKGSLVAPDRLRFDFSHFEALTKEQLKTIEDLVNDKIRANYTAETKIMSPEEAIADGAMALFGEKYDKQVRVLKMGDFSVELCGGTHVRATGDIGLFKIIAETGIAAGVRRIEAITGKRALEWTQNAEQTIESIAQAVKTTPDKIQRKCQQLLEQNKQLERELERLQAKLATSSGQDLAASAISIGETNLLAVQLEGVDNKALRNTLDQLKNKLGTAIIILASVSDSKISLVAGVTKDQTARVKAGELVNFVAQQVGGRGGGRPDMAQAGGDNPTMLPQALDSVKDWVSERLA